MKYDPDIHHRRSIRLRGYEYFREGAYFITICARNHECLFSNIENGATRPNFIGGILQKQWIAIPRRFPNVETDSFVVMPNHVHGIFFIVKPSSESNKKESAKNAPTVGDIVGVYKSLCVRHCLDYIRCNEPRRRLGKLWQRNYWERVVRDESELNRLREYIRDNPLRWELDSLYRANH